MGEASQGQEQRVALFDLDKTLVSTDTASLYIRYEHSIGRASLLRIAQVMGWGFLYWLGLIDPEGVASRALGWYAGRDVARLREEAELWAKTSVVPLIPAAARRAVGEHLSAGDFVAIATAAPEFVAVPIMGELGIEHLACSELEVQGGVLSGRLVPPLCYGRGKLERVTRLLERERGSADLSRAVAYSDSITDEPLLAAVGTAVAVNPDPRLARLARQRGWRIERW